MSGHWTQDEGRWVLHKSINDRSDNPDRYDEQGKGGEPILNGLGRGFDCDYGPLPPDEDSPSTVEARIRRELLEAEKACGGPWNPDAAKTYSGRE